MQLAGKDAILLIIGNIDSPIFPKELLWYTKKGSHLARIL